MVKITWDPVNGINEYLVVFNGKRETVTTNEINITEPTSSVRIYSIHGKCTSDPAEITIKPPPKATFSISKAINTFTLDHQGRYLFEAYNGSGERIAHKIFQGSVFHTGLNQEIPYLAFKYTFTELNAQDKKISEPSTPTVTGDPKYPDKLSTLKYDIVKRSSTSYDIELPPHKYIVEDITAKKTINNKDGILSVGGKSSVIKSGSEIIIYSIGSHNEIISSTPAFIA